MSDQSIACPDCGCESFHAVVLAVVGPKESLGLRCTDCNRAIAKTAVKTAQSDVFDAIAEVVNE
jgi:DNA-directed RNA polymerase subunit RPC12/RpoP